MRTITTALIYLSGVLSLGSHTQASAQANTEAVLSCHEQYQAAPEAYASALCFYFSAARSGQWDQTLDHLHDLSAEAPDNGWLVLVQGYVLASQSQATALERFALAADMFTRSKQAFGELQARANLRIQLYDRGMLAGAVEQLDHIRRIGETSTEREIQVRALLVEGRHFLDTGADLGRAHQVLAKAAALLTEQHPHTLHREVFNDLGRLNALLGRHTEALINFKKFADVALANDDPHGHALALVNIANTSLEAAMQRPTSADLRTLQAQAKQAVAAAQEIGSVRLSVLAQRLLAELTALTDPEASIALTHQCEKSARAAQLLWYEAECLWVRAVALAATDPTLAQNAIEKAVSLMQRAAGGEPRQLAFAWRNRMRVSVEVKPVKEAFAEGLQALSVFEALRGLQPNYQTRQAAFSVWARDYRWLAGIRLQGDFANAEADALATMERMRSRSLLEALHMGSRKPPEQMSRIRDEISEINKTLMEATTPTQAAPLLLQLAALEQDELELQTDTIRQLPAAPALADLQASLQADEVLLSYQTSPWTSPFERQPGGTWVLAISATLIQAVRLPEPEEIIRMKQLLRGLRFQQRAYQSVARIAYQRLVQPALQGLADVTRLTVIPDGPLSTFPFATVIPAAEQALAVTIAPSAALWQMWRSRDAARAAGRPLVIANPQIDNAMSTEQPWIGEAVSLSNLPSTEEEAQTIQQLFPEGKIWLRTQSTEAALRQTALDNFDMLHIAAHTVLNHRFPDRSALILGAGAESEDGLLQAREIAALNLEAKLVVLASCQSAGGREVGGEGVIGLSRAFLVAGADAVLASLWPIRDDHAATFFKHFYQNLAQEMPVRKALHLAQATLRDAKFPMEAWGGYVLIGDGRWRVAPQSQGYNYFWLLGVLCLAMLLPMLGWYLQRGGQR